MFKKIETNAFTIKRLETGVYHAALRTQEELDRTNTKDLNDAMAMINKTTQNILTIDISKAIYIRQEARELLLPSESVNETIMAVGLIADSLLSKYAGKLLIANTERSYPVHLFDSVEDANSWVAELIHDCRMEVA